MCDARGKTRRFAKSTIRWRHVVAFAAVIETVLCWVTIDAVGTRASRATATLRALVGSSAEITATGRSRRR